MTVTEFRKLIAQSENKEWFNSVSISIDFSVENQKIDFEGLPSLYQFAKKQSDNWAKMGDDLPAELKRSKQYFDKVLDNITQFVRNHSEHSYSDNDLDNTFNRYPYNILDYITGHAQNIFFYDSPKTEFLFSVYKDKSNVFHAVFSYLIGDLNQNIRDKNVLEGYLLAYQFESRDFSELVERKDKEKKSINRLRNEFQNQLPQLEKELVEHLANSSSKYKEYIEIIDQFKEDKEKLYSDWFINTKGHYEEFSNNCNTEIGELEKTYKEKLKLEEPAKYWSERGKKLKIQGWISLSVLVVLVLTLAESLRGILWNPPEEIFKSFFDKDGKITATAIRWSVVYVTFISFMAFLIKIVSKVMFSSFHLARDSEERYTLTYFYLALLKDSNISDNERELIMQSLFSRADTGLLKEDSSPTMPNDIVGKVLNKS